MYFYLFIMVNAFQFSSSWTTSLVNLNSNTRGRCYFLSVSLWPWESLILLAEKYWPKYHKPFELLPANAFSFVLICTEGGNVWLKHLYIRADPVKTKQWVIFTLGMCRPLSFTLKGWRNKKHLGVTTLMKPPTLKILR